MNYRDNPEWQRAHDLYMDPPGQSHERLMLRLQAVQIMLRIEMEDL